MTAAAVGIDFGTTKSVLSVFDHGEPMVVRNAEGSEVTPSIVGFTADGAVLVGEAARQHAAVNPNRVIRSVTQILEDTGISAEAIDHLVLVGGSTRIPAVAGLVEQMIGKQADPHSVGIETKGGIMHKLVRRSAPVPTTGSYAFTTTGDNQISALIQVYQGEREMVSYNRKLGTFELSGVAAAPRGVAHITITVDVDKHGIITAAATDLTSGSSRRMTVTPKAATAPATARPALWNHAITPRR